MIFDLGKEVSAIIDALGLDPSEIPPERGMQVAMILVTVLDKGMYRERQRCLSIVARKAMNAAVVREAINRPVR